VSDICYIYRAWPASSAGSRVLRCASNIGATENAGHTSSPNRTLFTLLHPYTKSNFKSNYSVRPTDLTFAAYPYADNHGASQDRGCLLSTWNCSFSPPSSFGNTPYNLRIYLVPDFNGGDRGRVFNRLDMRSSMMRLLKSPTPAWSARLGWPSFASMSSETERCFRGTKLGISETRKRLDRAVIEASEVSRGRMRYGL